MKLQFLGLALFLAAATHAQTVAPPNHTCSVVHTVPNNGDNALSSEDFDTASTFFSAVLKSSPVDEEARLGFIRAQIGQNKIADALKDSAAWVAASSNSVLAHVAAGEAAYRNGDIAGLADHIHAGLALNPCEGRVHQLNASVASLRALYATEARLLATAHKLRPEDELIRRDWMSTLSRTERLAEITKYLASGPHLSNEDLNRYGISEQHLRARRPHECHITSKTESTSIPLSPIGSPGRVMAFGLDVSLNGKRRRMQIDTGASGILLTPSAAKRLNLEPEFHLKTAGVGDDGKVDSYLTHVQTIQIGDIQISDCMVEVLNKNGGIDEIDGLIGLDVFSRSVITLDYPNQILQLSPLPPRPAEPKTSSLNDSAEDQEDTSAPRDAITPAGMEKWLHVFRIGHNILLPSELNLGPVHYMIMDTGAGRSILSTAFASSVGKLSKDDTEFRGISGKVKQTYTSKQANLSFGRLRLPPKNYFAFDLTNLSHEEDFEISGFVGLPTLSRLKIHLDYRDNLIQLDYDPNHDPAYFGTD